MTAARDEVIVLGRDADGLVVAEGYGMRYYLTDCCWASAKGVESGIACRSCYEDVDWAMGGEPEPVAEPFGDGLPYDQAKAQFGPR